jgi:hypothetical protein
MGIGPFARLPATDTMRIEGCDPVLAQGDFQAAGAYT